MVMFGGLAISPLQQRVFAQGEEKEVDEHVDFAANLEYIKGHLAQAASNKQSGQTDLAVAHAGHPVQEVYSLIEKELAEHDSQLNAKLKESLTTLANKINSMSASDVETQVTEINKMLDDARASVLGQTERSDPKFNAMVIISLLETAEHEYEEGVQGGKVVQMIEYQDATAFIARAEATFTAIKQQVPAHQAEEVAKIFATLNSDIKANADVKDIETSVDGIKHELDEVYGLEQGDQVDGQKIIDKINELLDESVAEYKAGNLQQARALAVEAYLDNYEFIESDIQEDNPDLMKKIEINMREKLVQMIDSKQPASQIESHVTTIKSDLETARTVVVPEFPTAIVAIAAIMAAVVMIGRTEGMNLFRNGSGSESPL